MRSFSAVQVSVDSCLGLDLVLASSLCDRHPNVLVGFKSLVIPRLPTEAILYCSRWYTEE